MRDVLGKDTIVNKYRSFNLMVMLCMSFVITSCAMEPEGESEGDPTITFELPQPMLAFEESDADTGVVRGSFEQAGHTITFEAIRGEPNPVSEYAPTYAIDARLCDERGFCFAMQAGGHGITNPAWFENQEILILGADPVLNHRMTDALHEEFVQLDRSLYPGLEAEFDALQALTDFPAPGSLVETPPPAGYESSEETSGLVALSYDYTHWIQIWWGYTDPPLAEHSATRAISVNSGGYVVQIRPTCNHGNCAGYSGMGLSCQRSFSNRPSLLAVSTPCDAAASTGTYHSYGDTASCCSSAYGFTSWYHVCNDDSALQRDMTITNSSLLNPSYCSDIWLAPAWAPGCW